MKRIGLLGIIASLASACALEGGERTGGECPEGEKCSELTPDGLYFTSVAPSDFIGELPGIALGGRQLVNFTPAGAYPLPDFAADGGELLTVERATRVDADSGQVELLGAAAGEGMLRILAQDESGLLDRIAITVATPERPHVRPFVGAGVQLTDFDGEWRLHASVSRLTLIAVLEAAGERLVDLDLDLQTDAPVAPGRPDSESGWDVLPIMTAGLSAVNVTVGTQSQLLEITDKIDDIREISVRIGDGDVERVLCFVGTDGGVPVFGAPLTASWDGETAALPFGEPIDSYPYFEWPCLSVIAAPGPHQVTIASGEVSRTFEVTVGNGPSAALRPSGARAGSFGERAR